jgi:hypothetical protein
MTQERLGEVTEEHLTRMAEELSMDSTAEIIINGKKVAGFHFGNFQGLKDQLVPYDNDGWYIRRLGESFPADFEP